MDTPGAFLITAHIRKRTLRCDHVPSRILICPVHKEQGKLVSRTSCINAAPGCDKVSSSVPIVGRAESGSQVIPLRHLLETVSIMGSILYEIIP